MHGTLLINCFISLIVAEYECCDNYDNLIITASIIIEFYPYFCVLLIPDLDCTEFEKQPLLCST